MLILATLFLLVALGTMVFEALSRFLIGHSYFWAEETVRFSMVACAFLGLSIAGFEGRHIRAELAETLVPRGVKRVFSTVSVLAGLVYSGILAWAGLNQALHVRKMGMVSDSSLELPLWIAAAAVPLGAALLFLFYLGRSAALLSGDAEPLRPTDDLEVHL